jgi:hypothetical protein
MLRISQKQSISIEIGYNLLASFDLQNLQISNILNRFLQWVLHFLQVL